MRRTLVTIAVAVSAVSIGMWALYRQAHPRGPTSVYEETPRYEAPSLERARQHGVTWRMPAEFEAVMKRLQDEIPAAKLLTRADAEFLAEHIRAGVGPNLKSYKARLAPGEKLPDDIIVSYLGMRAKADMAAWVAQSWIRWGQPCDEGAKDVLVEALRSLLRSDIPDDRLNGMFALRDSGLIKHGEIRAEVEALREDPNEYVAKIANLQLNRYAEMERLLREREARRARR